MEKLAPIQEFSGQYVSFSALPHLQQKQLEDWLPEAYLTELTIAGKLFTDCVAYEDYEFWFDHCFQSTDRYLEEAL